MQHILCPIARPSGGGAVTSIAASGERHFGLFKARYNIATGVRFVSRGLQVEVTFGCVEGTIKQCVRDIAAAEYAERKQKRV